MILMTKTRRLLTALAMGIDRAIRVHTDDELDSLQIARCLAAVVDQEQPDGVIVQYGGQTPLKLAMALEREGVPIIGTPPVDRLSIRTYVSEFDAVTIREALDTARAFLADGATPAFTIDPL